MAHPAPRAPGRRAPLRPLLLLLCALAPGAPQTSPGPSTAASPEAASPEAEATRDIVHPVRVDAGGAFLSYELWPRSPRKQRAAEPGSEPGSEGSGVAYAHYQLRLRGRDLRLHLGATPDLLAPGFVSETRRLGGLGRARIRRPAPPACHLQGRAQSAGRQGAAAISACDGLKGVFRLNDQDYFIEPLPGARAQPGSAQPHVVYQRPASQGQVEQGIPWTGGTCGVQEEELPPDRSPQPPAPGLPGPREPAFWQRAEGDQPKRQRRYQSSHSREKWVETLVVADADMVRHHGQPQVESYVLTIMNMVAGIFKNPSIGNPIHITVVRLIVLQDEVKDMKVQHEAHSTLSSFCEWQKRLNMDEDSHPLHHDIAVLITRKDLCTSRNQPCETLGLAHVGGICQPHLSCNVNEDTGLPTAFTVAHEIGHSLGILHDGVGNPCHPQGQSLFIMSPQLLYNAVPLNWSQCSREYITRFFDRGFGTCLDDPPARDVLPEPSLLPGALYGVDHQCRLQYGAGSAYCTDLEDERCGMLWCSVPLLRSCNTKKDPVVDGTPCGDQKWCLGGQCVSADLQPEVLDGGWSGWNAWSACSRSCGAGVQSSERQCTEPAPKNRGRFCVGERKRARLCNVQGCAPGSPSFRAVQCGQFDATPYRGRLYTWVPQRTDLAPCELHCKPVGESFSERLRDAVLDGTPCYEGRRGNRDICINGICQNVGCDFQINSGAVEDRCGVCGGNGSTCHTVSWVFQDTTPLGYVDVGQIPAGAREILIKELVPSGNFLALRSGDPGGRYFLNGAYSIHQHGDYPAAGTVFTYERLGDLERLTSPGPTNESIWIQMLFYEGNRGLYYEYTIQRDAIPPGVATEFSWAYGAWTDCSVTCGKGTQRQAAYCTERHYGTVDNRYCEFLGPPEERQRTCAQGPCPARWWASDWQACSRSCGPGGLARRAVYCLRSLGLGSFEGMRPGDCGGAPPPAAQPCNEHVPCPSRWAFGQWTPCSATCGPGVVRRAVACTQDKGVPCDEAERPPGEAPCLLRPCLRQPDVPDGSGSGGSFLSREELDNEVDFLPRRPAHQSPPPLLPPTLPTEPPGPGNAIDRAGPDLGPPGPAVVDDFYYDYNFIRFHENLAPDGDGDDGAGGPGLHPPSSSPPPWSGAPEPPTPPPAPLPSPAGPRLPPPPGRTPWDPLLNFLPEGDDAPPTGTPGLGPPASSEGTPPPPPPPPAAPGSPEASPAPSRPPPPRWESTNEVPEDEGGSPGLRLPSGIPEEGPPLSPARPSSPPPRPDPEEEELWPAVGGAPGPAPRLLQTPAGPWGPEPAAPTPLSPAGAGPSPPAGNASWEAGDWSQCSTSCGLGASWRAVRCSSGREEDCAPEGRPQPARRCHLRPCATWHAGNWSKCSQGCGGGLSVRDVQCVDSRDLRPLRPFHCRAGPAQPPARRPCGTQPCLSWYTSSWRECSEACGGGEQHRLVTCPEPGLCPEALRPNSTRPCNTHPCTQWAVGPWGECSAPCGGGVQRRVIRCVNTHLGLPEEDSGRCGHQPWPASSRPCATQDCEVSEQQRCELDQLPLGSCERLRLLGRCPLPSVRAQCCLTCHG